jgi:hypothetical protein
MGPISQMAFEAARAIETGVANSRRIVISDSGHLMYLEKQEEFTRIVSTSWKPIVSDSQMDTS